MFNLDGLFNECASSHLVWLLEFLSMSYSEVTLAEHPDDRVFVGIANLLIEKLNANVITKISDLDSTYWDLEIGSSILVLHQQTFVGITIFPKEGHSASEETIALFKAIGLLIKNGNT